MIITKISDGFGNQMFMFACGYAYARRLGSRLMLDISYLDTNSVRSYELDKLNICYDKIFTTKHLKFYILKVLYRKSVHALMHIFFRFYHEKQTYVYDEKVSNIKDNTYLAGYWQTEKYFRDYRTDLMRMFTPNYEPSNGCLNYIQLVQNCNSVAVHVRRGDYVNLGICLNHTYYENAFKKIEEQNSTFKNRDLYQNFVKQYFIIYIPICQHKALNFVYYKSIKKSTLGRFNKFIFQTFLI